MAAAAVYAIAILSAAQTKKYKPMIFMKNSAKTVYILTKEGRKYSDEGLVHVKNAIIDIFGDHSDLLFTMGQVLNESEKLIKMLKHNNGDGYLMISLENGGYYYHGVEEFDMLAQLFKEHLNENPWEVIANLLAIKYPEFRTPNQAV